MQIDVPTISAATALVAVIVGPLVSIYVVRRQIHASVVSANRQKWIDNLRDQLTDLITGIRFLGLHRSLDHIDEKEFVERLQQLVLVETKVNLLLNPNEKDHQALSQAIRQAIEKIFAGDEKEKRVGVKQLSDSIVTQSQAILKREWQRVKSGE